MLALATCISQRVGNRQALRRVGSSRVTWRVVLQDEKLTTLAITADMTRQYKSMQEELMRRINTLETTISEQKDQLEFARKVPNSISSSCLIFAAYRNSTACRSGRWCLMVCKKMTLCKQAIKELTQKKDQELALKDATVCACEIGICSYAEETVN